MKARAFVSILIALTLIVCCMAFKPVLGVIDDDDDKVSSTTIISYQKTKMTEKEIIEEFNRIKRECNCRVQHLPFVGAFILTYQNKHKLRSNVLSVNRTREVMIEDEVVGIFGDRLQSIRTPKDPSFHKQRPLNNLSNEADINAQKGWAEYLSDTVGGSPNGPSVIVAVIDTGVDYNNPELRNMMWTNPGEVAANGLDDDLNGIVDDVHGADFTSNTPQGDPIDRHSHGTHCAGIIGAQENNGEGIAGVASFTQNKVKIMAVKGLNDRGGGSFSGLLASLNYAIANGAKISSNSWGSQRSVSNETEQMWDNVLQNNLDHLFVAAAGNDNRELNETYTPMACGLKEPNLLCVASSTKRNRKSSFSNYGTQYVHVVAPGSKIYSTEPNNRYGRKSGTSMACPHVSGLAALIMSMRYNIEGEKLKQIIEANVQKKAVYDGVVSSGGLIDVGKTIQAVKSGGRCFSNNLP